METNLPEYAFYYPNPIWHYGDWIKNLILFFDGVALLVPNYMRERPFQVDPAIAVGLAQQGLLKILEPETFIDAESTETLATAMVNIIASGNLDHLAKEKTAFAELSKSRLGYTADEGLAELVHEALIQKGLARASEDGLSVPMHRTVRSLILVLLAQILCRHGEAQGLALYPATDMPRIQLALGELLNLPSMPSKGHVVSMDMETIGIDVSGVPIDEVLDYRAQHGAQYRKYARNLRAFVDQIANKPKEQQEEALKDRREEIRDEIADLQKTAENAWKTSTAGFAIAITGAAWSLLQGGDPVSAILSLIGTAVGATKTAPAQTSAYSYLFNARTRFA